MESSINWITFKAEDVQQAREILKDLGPDSTVDSIGLGLPFEQISNILFPATSTLHTRLRYQFFIAAIIYKMYVESNSRPLNNPEKRLYNLENELMEILKANNPDGGVIGRIAGAGLKYWPSQTYWGGLNTMRIFADEPVSRIGIFDDLKNRRDKKLLNDDGGDEETYETAIEMKPDFMKIAMAMFRNDNFKSNINFSLTKDEADFFVRQLKAIPVGRSSLLYRWTKLSRTKLKSIEGVISIPATGNTELDELVKQAKNYSRVAMGISHAYRYALCINKTTHYADKDKKQEWNRYAENNISNLDKWIKNNKTLKSWDIRYLAKALEKFSTEKKIDERLEKMFDMFLLLWKKSPDAEKLAKDFFSEAKRQERCRRGNRSHFEDRFMTIPDNAKGEQESDWLFDFRFDQGRQNALDLVEALGRKT